MCLCLELCDNNKAELEVFAEKAPLTEENGVWKQGWETQVWRHADLVQICIVGAFWVCCWVQWQQRLSASVLWGTTSTVSFDLQNVWQYRREQVGEKQQLCINMFKSTYYKFRKTHENNQKGLSVLCWGFASILDGWTPDQIDWYTLHLFSCIHFTTSVIPSLSESSCKGIEDTWYR